jgi:hypothetical protein
MVDDVLVTNKMFSPNGLLKKIEISLHPTAVFGANIDKQ